MNKETFWKNYPKAVDFFFLDNILEIKNNEL
jgi:hypothetical protein